MEDCKIECILEIFLDRRNLLERVFFHNNTILFFYILYMSYYIIKN